jgi:predicted small lipoprotein YifL
MSAARALLVAAVVVVAFAACGEKVQTIPVGTAKKADTQVWQTQDKRFLAPGWSPGDQASWEAQMTNRAQGQNDYAPRR